MFGKIVVGIIILILMLSVTLNYFALKAINTPDTNLNSNIQCPVQQKIVCPEPYDRTIEVLSTLSLMDILTTGEKLYTVQGSSTHSKAGFMTLSIEPQEVYGSSGEMVHYKEILFKYNIFDCDKQSIDAGDIIFKNTEVKILRTGILLHNYDLDISIKISSWHTYGDMLNFYMKSSEHEIDAYLFDVYSNHGYDTNFTDYDRLFGYCAVQQARKTT